MDGCRSDGKGNREARKAGELLKAGGFSFDIAFTSVLKRAIRTLWIALDELDLMWIPIEHSWRLNERHYGALQGLNKAETAAQVRRGAGLGLAAELRRSAAGSRESDPRYPGRDPRYRGVSASDFPLTECLKDTVARFLPYWHQTIVPTIQSGKKVIIAAHGNSLRALVKYLDGISDQEIVGLNIPTGVPLVYELDEQLKPLRHYYLGDPEAIAKATAAVASQGRAK